MCKHNIRQRLLFLEHFLKLYCPSGIYHSPSEISVLPSSPSKVMSGETTYSIVDAVAHIHCILQYAVLSTIYGGCMHEAGETIIVDRALLREWTWGLPIIDATTDITHKSEGKHGLYSNQLTEVSLLSNLCKRYIITCIIKALIKVKTSAFSYHNLHCVTYNTCM